MNFQCRICRQDCPKYKCPTCCIPYCSLSCWKDHKAQECTQPVTNGHHNYVENEVIKKKVYDFETEDTVPIEKLALLENDDALRQVLQNPHVRDMLIHIDSAEDPADAIQKAMLEPIFVEFADCCMKLVEHPPDDD